MTASLLADLEQLAGRATAMPERLASARQIMSNLRIELQAASDLVKDREGDMLALVSGELAPPIVGKPAFPNKEVREAEVRKRLGIDVGYRRLVDAETEVLRRKTEAEIQLNRLQDEDKSLERQLEAVGLALRAEISRGLEQAIREFTVIEARRAIKGA